MQHEIAVQDDLLNENGELKHKGYSKKFLLRFNPANIRAFPFSWINRLRLKEWDYYGTTTPDVFFSVAVSHAGYLGVVFAYLIDFAARTQASGLTLAPFGMGCDLPRTSESGDVRFQKKGIDISFVREKERRILRVEWEKFHNGQGLSASLTAHQPADMDSIVMATPIGHKGFYYKIGRAHV